MILIKHRGDPVEAEAVEAVLCEPVVAIGEEVVYHLATAVVEAERVPLRMLATAPLVKEERPRAIVASQALSFVAHSMRVDQVHNDVKAQGVRLVD